MSGPVTPASSLPPICAPWMVSERTTSCSGCGKGRGRRSTPSTMEKMAVVAPMPRASMRTAVSEKPGDLERWRTAIFRSRSTKSSWQGCGWVQPGNRMREARWIPDTVAGKYWFHRRLGRRGTNGVSGTVRRCPDQDGRGGRRGGAHVHAASRVRATAGRRGFGFGGKVFQHNSMAVGRGKFADEGGGSSERAVARAARTAGARDRVGGEDPQAACLQSSALSWFLARWQPAI